jgi:DNA-binding XRE family transcriptional regulator
MFKSGCSFYDIMDTENKSITVKDLRERKKLSRRKVAVALDVAETTILRWETGFSKPHLPLDKVKALMDLFSCDFETLYDAFELSESQYLSQKTIEKSIENRQEQIAS